MSQENQQFLADMQKITQLVRASKGLPPEPQDAISNLINVKNFMERSRFPTYGILSKIVYLELGYKLFGEKAKVLHDWAETEAHALIEYKGQGRGEWVEAVKRAEQPDQTNFTFGAQQPRQEKKRRFWQRKPKEQTEFKEHQ